MATKIEKIQALLEGIEADTRKATIGDFLADLKDALNYARPNEAAGLRVAIEILESNYA